MLPARLRALCAILALWPLNSVAAPFNQREDDLVVREFRFQSGETLSGMKLHYTTLGRPRRNPAGDIVNAVLLLHGTTGTGKSFLDPSLAGELFGAGQPLDAARNYIILPDGIGRGGSAKPSDGLRARFPRYGYNDLVTAQHLIVTQGLGVDHLRLVLGTSMGGMQAWLWAERFPELMDAVMPIASLPVQVAGRNLLWRKLLTEAIRADPDWRGGDYSSPPAHWVQQAPIFAMMTSTPQRLQLQAPTREAAEALWGQLVEGARRLDANDTLYWFESSFDYDPEPDLGKIKARVLALNFADDAVNPVELGVMDKLVKGIPGARYVLIPAYSKTFGHQTVSEAAMWKPWLSDLLDSLSTVKQ